jgi:adenylyltransferase/sulfurtransferase
MSDRAPDTHDTILSASEMQRYSRHLVLPEVGTAGQQRLKAASVLLVGTGGLGAPAGLYLAAAGVGRLGLVDFDEVDITNLQRQVTFGSSDVGRLKVEAARDRLGDLNPDITIDTHSAQLTRHNAIDILGQYDVIVDGTDNFATRYLINDAALMLTKPVVYGSVYRFDGQASVFGYDGGPCYRCLFPNPPPPGTVPSCADGGVLGVLPGIIGCIQATETIKIIIGAGDTLSERLLLFDALKMTFREVRISKNPDCPRCGKDAADSLGEYESLCDPAPAPQVPEISAADLKQRLDADDNVMLIDVREPHEREICNIGGLLIPLRELPNRMDALKAGTDIVVYCRTGIRSALAVKLLQDDGVERVWNLKGGIHAWADDVDSSLPKY